MYNYLKDYDDKRDGKISVLIAMTAMMYCVVFLFLAAVTRFTGQYVYVSIHILYDHLPKTKSK